MSVATPPIGPGWLRRALPATLVLLEFCWSYPWLLFLSGVFYGRAGKPLLPAWPAFTLLGLGFVVVRTVLGRPWSLARARAVVVTAGIAAGFAAVKVTFYPGYAVFDLRWVPALLGAAQAALPDVVPPAAGALAATLLWWRGVVLGERELSYFEVDRAFRRGTGWIAVFVILQAIYGDTQGFAHAAPAPAYLVGFFSLGLLMLAVARLLDIWLQSQADAEQALTINRHWVMLVVGVVGLIFSIAIAVSQAVNLSYRPVVLALLRPLEPVAEFVFYVLFAVATVIARLILLAWSRIGPVAPRGGLPRPAPLPSFEELMRDLPPPVVAGVRWGSLVLVIALLVLLVAISVVRARRRQLTKDEDERESVWSTEAALAGFGAALRSLWERLRAHPAPEAAGPVGTIRALYRELLRVGAGLGVPRQRHQTPYEYRPALVGRLPEVAGEIADLTDAYVRVRYTPHTPADEEIQAAQTALVRVKEQAVSHFASTDPQEEPGA